MNDFSIVRRRPGLLDILIPKQAGIEGYRFEWATNFDASYTAIFTATVQSGFLDRDKATGINLAALNSYPGTNRVRAAFNPATFSIPDNQHFWLRMVTVDFSGSDVDTTAGALVLTDPENHGTGRINVAGVAPNTGTVAGSLVLQLPRSMDDLTFVNHHATAGLYVAYQLGGPETLVVAQNSLKHVNGGQSLVLVRGDGAAVDFSLSFTNLFPE